jgi:hypothetical protein
MLHDESKLLHARRQVVMLREHRGNVARVIVGVAVEGHEPGVEPGGAVFEERRGVDDDLVPVAAEQTRDL